MSIKKGVKMILEKADKDLDLASIVFKEAVTAATVIYESKPPTSDREEVYKKLHASFLS